MGETEGRGEHLGEMAGREDDGNAYAAVVGHGLCGDSEYGLGKFESPQWQAFAFLFSVRTELEIETEE